MAEQRTIISEDQVTVWLGEKGKQPDLVGPAYRAAHGYVAARTTWPEDAEEAPGDLQLAVCLQTRRLLGRRDAWNGMVALTDETSARLPGADSDVLGLMAPWRPVVFG